MTTIVAQDYTVPQPYKSGEHIDSVLLEHTGHTRSDFGKYSNFWERKDVGECYEIYTVDFLTAIGLNCWRPKQEIPAGKDNFAKYQIDVQVDLGDRVSDIEVKARNLGGNIWRYGSTWLCPLRQFDLKAKQPEFTFLMDMSTGETVVGVWPLAFWGKERSPHGTAYAFSPWLVVSLEDWIEEIAFRNHKLLPDHPASAYAKKFIRAQRRAMKKAWEAEQAQLAA